MKVYLIRHGQSVGNALNISQNQKNDLALTEKGIDQARRVGQRLAKENLDTIYSSDLKRAVETAEEIAKHHSLNPIQDKRLRERDFGDLDDKENLVRDWKNHVKKVVAEQKIHPEEVKAPNGESDKDHWNRLDNFLKEKLNQHKGKTIAVVAHAVSNKVLLGTMGHYTKKEMYQQTQGNTGVNEFEHTEGKWKVHKVNSIHHLEKDERAIDTFNKAKEEASKYNFSERWMKNEHLFNLLKDEGYRTKYEICLFKWADQNIPKEILELAHPEEDRHLIVSAKVHGIAQRLDVNNFTALKDTGDWDSYGDCTLSVIPTSYEKGSGDKDFPQQFVQSQNNNFQEFYQKVSKFFSTN